MQRRLLIPSSSQGVAFQGEALSRFHMYWAKDVRLHVIVYVFDADVSRDFIRANVLDLNCVEAIQQRDMPAIRSAFDNKPKGVWSHTLYLCMGELRTCVTIGPVSDLNLRVFLNTAYTERLNMSVYLAKRKIVRHHFL